MKILKKIRDTFNKPERFDEYNFLDLFYQKKLKVGEGNPWLSVDKSMVKDIHDKFHILVTEGYLQKMAVKCVNRGQLNKGLCRGEYYYNMELTDLGILECEKEERLNNRSILRKFSDLVVDYKGLVTTLNFIIATVALFRTF